MMQCVVLSCDDSKGASPKKTTYFKFPTEPALRTAWLKKLHRENWEPDENSAICIKHFLPESVFESNNGMKTLREGAMPIINVQVCRICFAINCRLYPLTSNKLLYKAYETLTGLLIEKEDKVPPYLCNECAHELLKFGRFQTKTLDAHSILLEIYTKHNCITLESIQSIHGVQNPLNSTVAHNQTELYDIDLEFAEVEYGDTNEHTDTKQRSHIAEYITVDCVKAENDDMVNKENNQPIEKNFSCNKDLTNDVMVYALDVSVESLHMDKVSSNYKTKINVVENGNLTDRELNNNADIHGDTLEGGILDDEPHLENEQQNAEETTMDSQEVITEPEYIVILIKEDLHTELEAEVAPILIGGTTTKSPVIIKRRQSLKRRTKQIQETKVPKHLDHTIINEDTKLGAEGTLLSPKFTCDICNFQTNIDVQLMSHLKAHAASKSFNCRMCNYKTIHKRSLIWHNRIHSGEKPYSCDMCKTSFTKKSHLHNHIKKHLDEKPYVCDLCNKGFNRKDCLKVHLKSHLGVRPYSCKVCNKTFSAKCSLQKHFRKHSGDKEYLCHICVTTFTEKNKLQAHLKFHSDEKPYLCDVCNKTFLTKESVQRHIRMHTSERPFLCNICSKTFKTKDSLRKHCSKHSDNKLYSCHVCGNKIVGNNKFEEHFRIHPGEKPFSCDVCNHLFARKACLEKHMRLHTDGKPYLCRFCNKTFTTKVYLQSHSRIHSGEKPYSCNICSKAFTLKAYLRKHLRKHSGEKPYTCDTCNKSFTTKDYLLIHFRVHSGERPYACNVCDKAFTRKDHLQNHSRIHLRIQDVKY